MNPNEIEEAKKALIKVAQKKAKDMGVPEYVKDQAMSTANDIGISDDMLKYGAGAAKLADILKNKEIEGSMDLSDDVKLKGKISPREKALKLLYKKSF